MTTTLKAHIDMHANAARAFQREEKALESALMAFDLAEDRDSILSARKRAEAAQKAAIAAWEATERARQAYWNARLAETRQRLQAETGPLLADFMRSARCGMGLTPPLMQARMALDEVMQTAKALPDAAKNDVPPDQHQSAILERADQIL